MEFYLLAIYAHFTELWMLAGLRKVEFNRLSQVLVGKLELTFWKLWFNSPWVNL